MIITSEPYEDGYVEPDDIDAEPDEPVPKGEHTPGPWKVVDDPGGVLYVSGLNAPTTDVCDLHDYSYDCLPPGKCADRITRKEDIPGTALANAKLIAAAPELLEALRMCKAKLEDVAPIVDCAFEHAHATDCMNVAAVAAAAIQSAT